MKNKWMCFLLMLLSLLTFAQKESNIWYFGYNAGLDFNSGNPLPLTDGALSTLEGCATISDENGKLLFYTDGITVYNKIHDTMQNGTGLAGNSSSTQAAIIVPKPKSKTIYYIFTSDIYMGLGTGPGFNYSEVDMSLSTNMGEVTNKNVFLLPPPLSERLVAVEHANGKDIWVITTDMQSTTFYSFLVTSNGIITQPVVSTIGTFLTGKIFPAGCLKASPNGSILAMARTSEANPNDLLHFDTATGEVSDWISLPQVPQGSAYGLEFSPDGNKLYVNSIHILTFPFTSTIHQYDLSSGSPAGILSSCSLIDTLYDDQEKICQSGTVQLGPDNKIYITNFLSTKLACIQSPNALGKACNLVNNAIDLNGRASSLGLPGFISNYTSKDTINVSDTIVKTIISIPNIVSCNEDGINDAFVIQGLKAGTSKLQVFNRWGNTVYSSDYYSNDWKPQGLNDGVYYYILYLEPDHSIHKGFFSVLH